MANCPNWSLDTGSTSLKEKSIAGEFHTKEESPSASINHAVLYTSIRGFWKENNMIEKKKHDLKRKQYDCQYAENDHTHMLSNFKKRPFDL